MHPRVGLAKSWRDLLSGVSQLSDRTQATGGWAPLRTEAWVPEWPWTRCLTCWDSSEPTEGWDRLQAFPGRVPVTSCDNPGGERMSLWWGVGSWCYGEVIIRALFARPTVFFLLVPRGSVWGPGQAPAAWPRPHRGGLPPAQVTCPDISEKVLSATQGSQSFPPTPHLAFAYKPCGSVQAPSGWPLPRIALINMQTSKRNPISTQMRAWERLGQPGEAGMGCLQAQIFVSHLNAFCGLTVGIEKRPAQRTKAGWHARFGET